MNAQTGVVDFPFDPALADGNGDPFMNGLPQLPRPVLGQPQTNVAQLSYNSDFAGEPYMYGYDANTPGSGLGDAPTAVVRPRPGAAPGWPGFFAWVANESPQMYNYLRVSLPNFVEDRQSYRSGAPELSGLGDITNPDWMTISQTPAYTEGVTNSTPLPTKTGVSQIIDTVKQAAAAFLPLVTQQRLLTINVDRARQGLPPIDTASYESASQGLNVGINRSTQSTLLMLAAGIGGVFLLSKVLSKR